MHFIFALLILLGAYIVFLLIVWLVFSVLSPFHLITPTPTTVAPTETPAPTTVAPTETPASPIEGFYGPFGKSWSSANCPLIGAVTPNQTLDQCKRKCLGTTTCNVITFGNNGDCSLQHCQYGQPPQNVNSLVKGYSTYPVVV